MRAQMSLIMGQIEPEHPDLFALEFGKIAESDFVYTLASTNIDQSASNLVKIYMTIRSRMSSIVDLIGPELGPRGSVVECLTRNPGVLGSSLTGSSGFFSWECPWARHFRA